MRLAAIAPFVLALALGLPHLETWSEVSIIVVVYAVGCGLALWLGNALRPDR